MIRRILLSIALTAGIFTSLPAGVAFADGPQLHSAGSTWVQIAMQQWTSDVNRFGLNVDYQGIGSTAGREDYMYNLIDFAATEIPYQPEELDLYHRELGGNFRNYQYVPDVAGGTAFMYNLNDPSTGERIRSLRLNSDLITRIFTGKITSWRDPAILALNPGVNLPSIPLIPVTRSDSSGTSGQLSLYLANQQPGAWGAFASRLGCTAPCANWATDAPFVGQSLSSGVTNYVAATPGAINYVEAGYALAKGFPVAYVQNASGNFSIPLSENVSTALSHAQLNPDLTQNLAGVYNAPEPAAYPISSYSYLITPTSNIDPAKGNVLGKFMLYAACGGQQQAPLLGYSPLPENLVQTVFDAINRINGHPTTPDLSTPEGRAACPNPNWTQGGGDSSFAIAAILGGSSTTGGGGAAAATSGTSSATGVFSASGAASKAQVAQQLVASRRTAAAASIAAVHLAPSSVPTMVVALLLLLIFGPLLVHRRRSARRTPEETA